MFGAQYQQPYTPQMMQPQGFQNPYLERFNALTQPQMQQPQRYDIIQVNGRNGAEAFRMAPNSRCLLLDEKDPIVWLVTSDGAGYQTATPYSITPYQQPNPQGDLMDRLNRLEAVVYGQSNPADAQQAAQQPAGGPTAAEISPADDAAVSAVPAADGRQRPPAGHRPAGTVWADVPATAPATGAAGAGHYVYVP